MTSLYTHTYIQDPIRRTIRVETMPSSFSPFPTTKRRFDAGNLSSSAGSFIQFFFSLDFFFLHVNIQQYSQYTNTPAVCDMARIQNFCWTTGYRKSACASFIIEKKKGSRFYVQWWRRLNWLWLDTSHNRPIFKGGKWQLSRICIIQFFLYKRE